MNKNSLADGEFTEFSKICCQVDIEELKLALGLRIQHAARAGMDGDGVGWTLMEEILSTAMMTWVLLLMVQKSG